MAEKFKLKHGWPFPDYKEGVPFSYHARSSFFIALVGGLGKMWLSKYLIILSAILEWLAIEIATYQIRVSML